MNKKSDGLETLNQVSFSLYRYFYRIERGGRQSHTCMSFQREFLSNFCAQNLQSHYLFSLLHLSFITVAMIGHNEIQPTKFKSLFELKSSTSV